MTDLPSKMVARQVRALEMLRGDVRIGKVLGSEGDYVVPSQSGKGFYRVHVPADPNTAETCSCPDFEERQAPCKHIHLVRMDQRAKKTPPRHITPESLPQPVVRSEIGQSTTSPRPRNTGCSTLCFGTSRLASQSPIRTPNGRAVSPSPCGIRPSAPSSGPTLGSRFAVRTASGHRPRRTDSYPIRHSGQFPRGSSADRT